MTKINRPNVRGSMRPNVRQDRNGSTFNPNSIAGLKVWISADFEVYSDAGVTLCADGDSVQQWNDKSGNGNNLAQSTSSLRPIFKTSIINGRPVVRFDGVDDLMNKAYSSSMVQPVTMFLAVNDKTAAAQNSIIDSTDDLLRHVFGKYVVATPGTFGLYAYTGGGFDGVADSWPTGFRVWSLVFDASSSSITKNGVLVQAGTVGTDVSTGLRIGANNSGGGSANVWADMDMAELLIYNAVLSPTNTTLVEAYLNLKYNIY